MRLSRPLLATAVAVALLIGGCGEGQRVEAGATVTVYAAAPACRGAKRVLEDSGGRAGTLRVRVHCLAPVKRGGGFDLAAIGANARRAVEDSTAVAYIGEVEPSAARFSETILEEADIPQLPGMSGAVAMQRLLPAIERAAEDPEGLRESVHDELR